MKAIYFPYTYFHRETLETIQACLGSFVVYQPSESNVPDSIRRWAADNLIELCTPTFGDDDRLDLVVKEYHQWAALHSSKQGVDLSYLQHHRDRPPFFDDTASSQIRSDIKRRLETDAARSDKIPDDAIRLLEARIYLSIAQQLDVQSESVQQDMQRVSDLEKTLLKDLTGSNGTSGESSVILDDGRTQQEYMLSQRMDAWSWLLMADTVNAESEVPGLFVTSSRAAMERVVESQPQVQTLAHIDGIPVAADTESLDLNWQNRIVKLLSSLARGEQADQEIQGIDSLPKIQGTESTGKEASLSVYIVPDKQPLEVFRGGTDQFVMGSDLLQPAEKIKNTILCAVSSRLK
jgi:hypothetical protein